MQVQFLRTILITTLICVGVAFPGYAQDALHGNGALQIFDAEGMANSPQWVMGWIAFMLATFVVGLIFAFQRKEARLIMAFIVGGFIALAILTRGLGFAEISGLIALFHLIFWTPALIILLRNRWFLKESSWFGRWTGVLTFVIMFSFIFDIRDAAIYVDHIAGLGVFA